MIHTLVHKLCAARTCADARADAGSDVRGSRGWLGMILGPNGVSLPMFDRPGPTMEGWPWRISGPGSFDPRPAAAYRDTAILHGLKSACPRAHVRAMQRGAHPRP